VSGATKLSLQTITINELAGRQPSRRFQGADPPQRVKYARYVGEITLAWNSAHANLYQIFGTVIMDYDWDMASAIWHSFQSDSAQRNMLESSLNQKLDLAPQHRRALIWSISILNRLATHRNEIVHSDVLFFGSEFAPGPGVRPQFYDRMTELPINKKWRLLSGDLHAVSNYLHGIFMALIFATSRPLLRKPRLLFSRSKTASSQEARRRAKKAARERQRQSSQR
jgi:hypothetical protein